MTEQEYLSKNPKAVQKKQQANPTPANPVHIQRLEATDLQRLVGNRQAQRMLAQRKPENSKPPMFIQTKMTVGAADDAYEQEADSVASQVMAMRDTPSVQRAGEEDELATMRIQRQEDDDELQAMRIQRAAEEDELATMRIQRVGEEDELATMRIQRAGEEDELATKRMQRQAAPQEEDEPLMAMRIQRAGDDVDMMGSFDVGDDIENTIDSTRGSGSPLPDEARGFFEDRMGYDFSNVNVHTDSTSQNVNRSIQAQAFTTGSDIYFNEGKYNPGSDDGKQLLAHELTHVVQQGGAAPKVQPDREEKK